MDLWQQSTWSPKSAFCSLVVSKHRSVAGLTLHHPWDLHSPGIQLELNRQTECLGEWPPNSRPHPKYL